MSIAVAITDLPAVLGGYDWAYLLTVRDDGRPHTVAVTPRWDGAHLVVEVGRGTAANALARPAVTLCWPPSERDGHSLIIDAAADVDGPVVRLEPQSAVLHRPAPAAPG